MIVVPQENEDDITSGKMAEIKDGKIIFNVKLLPIAPREELDRIAKLIQDT
jgi:hypothetical protein